MSTTAIGIAASVLVSLFGIKSLLIFASQNGTIDRLAKATESGLSHSGHRLGTLTTNGRFASVDRQLNAVCVFYLVYCEDWSVPETSLAGLACTYGWAVMWALIMLDSLRVQCQRFWLYWIWLPGTFIFNYTAAAMGPLYLAFRLALTPLPTTDGLYVDPSLLEAIPWAFVLGFVLPIAVLCLPEVNVGKVNLKHTFGAWYQYWHIYISGFYYILPVIWRSQTTKSGPVSSDEAMRSLRGVYMFVFALAAVNHWIPILAAIVARTQAVLSGKKRASLSVRDLFFPASPFSDRKVKSTSEGLRWLIQWDDIVSAMGTVVWAATAYFQARGTVLDGELMPVLQVGRELILPGLLGGPMGVAVALMWWRDELVLGRRV